MVYPVVKLLFVLLAGCAVASGEAVQDLVIPHDDTATVQTAATTHTCLAPGSYYVVTPPPPRHDYAVLGGAVGCDPANPATLYFVGDGATKFWVGLAPRSGDHVENVVLNTTLFVNADPNGKNGNFEQTH